MDRLEELLPGIEKYLRTTLAKETLSESAEKQRQDFIERLDILQLPPHLPPKPDGAEKPTQMQGRKLPTPIATTSSSNNSKSSTDDFIAQQRAISRQTCHSVGSVGELTTNPVPNNGLGIDSDQYEEGLYEEPVPMDSNLSEGDSGYPTAHMGAASTAAATFEVESDADSSTSYESYDEPDLDEPYNNVAYDGQLKTDIPLPRLKTKRKKKKVVSINERYYKQLKTIIQEGELYHRGKVVFTSSWTKRYCAICDGIFYCYKDSKDSKPIFSVPLLGYDVIQQDKEKGRSNVLRLSHPGCETHFLSTDSVSETQAWYNRIESTCNSTNTTTTTTLSNSADQGADSTIPGAYRTGSISSMETYTDNPSSLVNGSPHMKNRKVTSTMSSDSSSNAASMAAAGGKREKKGKIGKFLSETFGKKKGRAAAHHLEISEGSLLDRTLSTPDIIISGLVKLNSPDLLGESTWQHRHCAIRNGVFECFKDDSTSSDLEFSLLLTDYELLAHAPEKDSLSLTVTRQGQVAFIIEPENKLDQGDWLSAMLKHVGNGGVPAAAVAAGPSSQQTESSGDRSYDDDELAYTYVDHREVRGVVTSPLQNGSMLSNRESRDEDDDRLYADLSDRSSAAAPDDVHSDEGSGIDEPDVGGGGSEEEEGDEYDEPPVEAADRSSKVYEEVSEDNRNSILADDSGQENQPTHNISNDNADNDQFTDDECINFTKPIVNAITTLEQKVSESPRKTQSAQISPQSPNTPERQTRAVTKTKERQTRADKQTKAQQRIVSPTPSPDSIRQTFSRESSCSSEGSAMRLSETVARNKALFENNGMSSNTTPAAAQKWPGYKLAGAKTPVVRRTSSHSSTASNRSSPNSATSSPKTSRANLSTLISSSAASGNVDRFKATFEQNNNSITAKSLSPSPNTKRKAHTSPQQNEVRPASGSVSNNLFNKKKATGGRISPIKISPDQEQKTEKPPPSFTSIFQQPTTTSFSSVSAGGNKPRKLEIKTATPYVNPAATAAATGVTGSKSAPDIDTKIRFEIGSDSSVSVISDQNYPPFHSVSSSAALPAKSSSTLPATMRAPALLATHSFRTTVNKTPQSVSTSNDSRTQAKSFLTSALSKFAAEDSSRSAATAVGGSGSALYTYSSEAEEQSRLEQLRLKLTSLREERKKIRDQKLSTMLPESIERLNAEYKRIDTEYKTTHKEIDFLEDRKLKRIKQGKASIERRKSDAESRSLADRKKMWETSS